MPDSKKQVTAPRYLRMPSEWEPHRATWLSWPHNTETWPTELEEVERTFVEITGHLSRYEHVHINVNDADHQMHVRGLLSGHALLDNVSFHLIPTNDAWIRDHGAIFVEQSDGDSVSLAATNWRFNSWGEKYPPWNLDNDVPPQMADILRVPYINYDLVLEGGSIDVNGAGLLLTTEQCLLNPNRNPGYNKEEIEAALRDAFGIRQFIWLKEGITGDDTDGHIDDIARFVDTHTVVAVIEEDPDDENYPILQDNLARLRAWRSGEGKPLRVVTLPMPSPVYIRGTRMPASYANFYVANEFVLVPVYADPADQVALDTLQALFPSRKIVPVDCREIIWGLGAVHCLTQQVPLLSR